MIASSDCVAENPLSPDPVDGRPGTGVLTGFAPGVWVAHGVTEGWPGAVVGVSVGGIGVERINPASNVGLSVIHGPP